MFNKIKFYLRKKKLEKLRNENKIEIIYGKGKEELEYYLNNILDKDYEINWNLKTDKFKIWRVIK